MEMARKCSLPLLVWLLLCHCLHCVGSVQLLQTRRSTSPLKSLSSIPQISPLHLITQGTALRNHPPPSTPAPPENVDVVVVGAGLCGSTAAFYLDKQGYRVLLAEKESEVGGCVNTKQKDGFLWEEGANSFQPTPKTLQIAKDIGILDQLVLANASLPRFIFWDGKLQSLPTSLRTLWSTKLLSWWGKLRLLRGLLGGVRRKKKGVDESIEEFSTRHFGEEVSTRMVDPFVSGVYAGSPNRLSVAATLSKVSSLEAPGITRSVIEGALVNSFRAKPAPEPSTEGLPVIPRGSLGSFKQGLQSLPLQVQTVLGDKCRVSHSLRSLKPCRGGGWLATFRDHAKDGNTHNDKTYFARSVLLTTPAYTTAQLLGGDDEEEAKSLRRGLEGMALLPPSTVAAIRDIEYPPVVGVYLAYPNEAFREPVQGFGHLIPRANKIRSLGTIWCSALFPGRAPPGYTLLLTFIGGAQDTQIVNLSTQELVQQVDQDLRRIMLKSDAPPPRVISVKTWKQGIPQFNRGYLNVQGDIREAVASIPGLFLGGNFVSGVSVGDCISYGAMIATNISDYLLKSRFR